MASTGGQGCGPPLQLAARDVGFRVVERLGGRVRCRGRQRRRRVSGAGPHGRWSAVGCHAPILWPRAAPCAGRAGADAPGARAPTGTCRHSDPGALFPVVAGGAVVERDGRAAGSRLERQHGRHRMHRGQLRVLLEEKTRVSSYARSASIASWTTRTLDTRDDGDRLLHAAIRRRRDGGVVVDERPVLPLQGRQGSRRSARP